MMIPIAVIEKAKTLISLYGENIVQLGEKNGIDVYMFKFPEGSKTGYPFVFLYDKETGNAKKITGFDAVDIIGEFVQE